MRNSLREHQMLMVGESLMLPDLLRFFLSPNAYMASDRYFAGLALARFLSLNPQTHFCIVKTRIGWKVWVIPKTQCLASIPLTWIHTQSDRSVVTSIRYARYRSHLTLLAVWRHEIYSTDQFPQSLSIHIITSSHLPFVVTPNQLVGLLAFQLALRILTVTFIGTFEHFQW